MKGIVLKQWEVQAILDGRKSRLTRKINWDIANQFDVEVDGSVICYIDQATGDTYKSTDLSKYQVGDILFVKETWTFNPIHEYVDNTNPKYVYKSDEEFISWGWHPSIHMPVDAARTFLRVTGVRVERLQDITEEQAINEGITKLYDNLSPEEYKQWSDRVCPGRKQDDCGYTNYLWHGHIGVTITGKQSDAWKYQCSAYDCSRDSYFSLWESNLKLKDIESYGYDANPWVFIYEFERISKEEAYARI